MTVQFCTECSSTYGIPMTRVMFTTIGDNCDVCHKKPHDGCHLAHPNDHTLISEIILSRQNNVKSVISQKRNDLAEDEIQDEITAELEIYHANFKVTATTLMYDDILPFKDKKKGDVFILYGIEVKVTAVQKSKHPRGYVLTQLFLRLAQDLPAEPAEAYSNLHILQNGNGDWFLRVHIKKKW